MPTLPQTPILDQPCCRLLGVSISVWADFTLHGSLPGPSSSVIASLQNFGQRSSGDELPGSVYGTARGGRIDLAGGE